MVSHWTAQIGEVAEADCDQDLLAQIELTGSVGFVAHVVPSGLFGPSSGLSMGQREDSCEVLSWCSERPPDKTIRERCLRRSVDLMERWVWVSALLLFDLPGLPMPGDFSTPVSWKYMTTGRFGPSLVFRKAASYHGTGNRVLN